jgi:uncharacterized RDD family membrane protein YckC
VLYCAGRWVAITAAVGVPLLLSGVTRGLAIGALNLIATLVMVIAITLGLAALESSPWESSIGKRIRGLTIVDARTGGRISFRRALARNALKIALPWMIGHAAVFGIVDASASGSVPPSIWMLTAVAYLLPIAYVLSLFVGSGRTLYDRIAGTVVVKDAR